MAGPILFVNPGSGQDDATDELIGAARNKQVEVVVLDGDFEAQVDAACASGPEVIGVAGGDGTLALVAQRCLDADAPFVVIPFGTRNHFARDVGLDRDDPIAALDAFTDPVEQRIDVAQVGTERIFLNNATFGVYAEVVDEDDYRDAKVRTSLRVARELLRGERDPDPIAVTAPDGTRYEAPFAILIGNNCYETASLRGLGQRSELDRGQLQVWVLEAENALDLASVAGATLSSGPQHHPNVAVWLTPELHLDAQTDEVKAGIDGEATTLRAPLDVRVLPRALAVHLPRAAIIQI